MTGTGDDQQDRTAQLERQIENLEAELSELRRQLAEAELDKWRGRIDDLEVQVHLASLDAQDRLEPLIENLRDTWSNARETLSEGAATAIDVAGTLRAGLDQAMADLRRAVLDARSISSD